MKALVKFAPGKKGMGIRDIPIPSLQPRQVLVKIRSVGICGTDLKIMRDEFPCNLPVVVGHEFSGVIEKTGTEGGTWRPGDRIVAEQHFGACGTCFFCLTGKRHFCPHKTSPGYAADGAFTEYIAVDESLLHRIPATISFREACVVEPMAVAAYGVLGRAEAAAGETAVILGCGPIALLAIQLLKAAGLQMIIVTGLDEDEKNRFALARKLGADRTINVRKSDPLEAVHNLTGGLGADLVVDLSGSPAAIVQGLSLLRKDGRFCALGLAPETIGIDWTEAALKAVKIIFSFSSDYISWEKCLGFLSAEKVNLHDFTHQIFPLHKWEYAFDLAASGKVVKVIMEPQ